MSIEQRIEKLESENRRLYRRLRVQGRLATLGIFTLAIAAFYGVKNTTNRKNADFDIVTARQIRVVDEDDKPMVLLSAGKQTSPSIVQGYVAVLDDKQNGSTILGHWQNGDVLWFTGSGDQPNLYLSQDTAKGEAVVQSYAKGKVNFKMFADSSGSGVKYNDGPAPVIYKAPYTTTIADDLKRTGTP